jgi:hypothetical protein
MKIAITAIVPTVYQLNSIRALRLPVNRNLDGSYSINVPFNTKKEAQKHLRDVAMRYADNIGELRRMISEIKKGYLTIDAVTANIKRI